MYLLTENLLSCTYLLGTNVCKKTHKSSAFDELSADARAHEKSAVARARMRCSTIALNRNVLIGSFLPHFFHLFYLYDDVTSNISPLFALFSIIFTHPSWKIKKVAANVSRNNKDLRDWSLFCSIFHILSVFTKIIFCKLDTKFIWDTFIWP